MWPVARELSRSRSWRWVAGGIGAALAGGATSAGVAAIADWMFTDVPALSEAELDSMRGGLRLSLPNLDLNFNFGFKLTLDTEVQVPSLPNLAPVLVAQTGPVQNGTGLGQQAAAVAPSVTVSDARSGTVLVGRGATSVADPGAAVSGGSSTTVTPPGTAGIAATTTVEVNDPKQAAVTTVVTQNGQGRVEKMTVDLTRETLGVQVGSPGAALVTHQINMNEVTTAFNSMISNTTLINRTNLEVFLDGLPMMQTSPAVMQSLLNLQDALSLR